MLMPAMDDEQESSLMRAMMRLSVQSLEEWALQAADLQAMEAASSCGAKREQRLQCREGMEGMNREA